MEIALYSKINDPVKSIVDIGTFFARSGMFGCEKIEQGQVLAMECLATGKPPSVIARTYHIMDGKLSKKALAALAEFRAIGGKHKWVKDGTDGKEAVLDLTLDDNTITSRFTIDEAKSQGLIRPKSNWEKTPANMLRARAISNGVAMLAPEIYAGDVSDEDVPAAVASEPLLKSKPEVSTTAAAASQPGAASNVIDIPATSVPVPEAAKTEPAEAVKKYTEADIAASPETGNLTVNSLGALESVIGEANMAKAIVWLKNRNWITEGLSSLSVDRAKRIFAKPENFLKEIGA